MKHLIPFRVYEAQKTSDLTPDQEDFLTTYTQGTWSVNPTTGLVDVQGNFNCKNKRLKSLSGISFGHVSGNFYCPNNRLTSLAGAPQTVGGGFFCEHNRLTSLAGAPRTVGGDFYCFNNQLTFLAGAPETVDGDFDCDYNQLTSLEGAPQTVDGNFYCSYNQLTSLAGAPQTVGGRFHCENNQLTSLAGAPQTVGENFDCSYNQLTSLEGAPQTVDGDFYCDFFFLYKPEWNFSGWMKILSTGDAAARKLMKTLPYLQPDWWNSELQRDPGKRIHLLALWWKDMPEDWKSRIVIPPGYENEFGLFTGFDELGLF